MIRPGLCSVTFRPATPREIVGWVREAGLASIEWGGDKHVPPADLANARAVGEMTRQAGLAVASYGSYYRLAGVRPQAPFEEVVAAASALGAPLIRVWAGEKDAAEATEADWSAVAADALRCADLAAAAGCQLGFEWHGETLASGNANARRLLDLTLHPAITAYWQPENGREPDYCLEGLRENLARISQIHVFHWFPTAAERNPLAAGADRWRAYLAAVSASGRDHDALLEFVKGDAPEQFAADAQTLLELLELSALPAPLASPQR